MKPKVSILIVSYNMRREVPRTVVSFLPPYQRGIDLDDVEVIVLENGSSCPIDQPTIDAWPPNLRYVNVERPSASPARALNLGAAMARGDYVCPVIDGARMASPGLIAKSLDAMSCGQPAFVATIGLHLGPKAQQVSSAEGYDQIEEDRLLASFDWFSNGYKLFEKSSLAVSSKFGWFGPIVESNAPILPLWLYEKLGGFDEAFDFPGGGIVNLDFFNRAIEDEKVRYFLLLGEATFHQYHGGVTTSRSSAERSEGGPTDWERYVRQYAKIRGFAYRKPQRRPDLFGHLPSEAMRLASAGIGEMMKSLP